MDNSIDMKFLKEMERHKRLAPLPLLEGLSKQEFFASMSIFQYERFHPGAEGIYMSELCECMKSSKAAISRMIKVAELKGIFIRKTDSADRRNTYVILTPLGREILFENHKIISGFYNSVFDRVGEDKIKQLICIMDEINEVCADELKLRLKEKHNNNKGAE